MHIIDIPAKNFKNYFVITDIGYYKNTDENFNYFDYFENFIFDNGDEARLPKISKENPDTIFKFEISKYTNILLRFSFEEEDEAFYFKMKYG